MYLPHLLKINKFSGFTSRCAIFLEFKYDNPFSEKKNQFTFGFNVKLKGPYKKNTCMLDELIFKVVLKRRNF